MFSQEELVLKFSQSNELKTTILLSILAIEAVFLLVFGLARVSLGWFLGTLLLVICAAWPLIYSNEDARLYLLNLSLDIVILSHIMLYLAIVSCLLTKFLFTRPIYSVTRMDASARK